MQTVDWIKMLERKDSRPIPEQPLGFVSADLGNDPVTITVYRDRLSFDLEITEEAASILSEKYRNEIGLIQEQGQ